MPETLIKKMGKQFTVICVYNFVCLFVCLFFSEDKLPFNLEECSTCISRSAWEDWCRDVETSKDHFFVMVAAYESYDNAVLKITGGNIKTIEETDNDKGCKTFKL